MRTPAIILDPHDIARTARLFGELFDHMAGRHPRQLSGILHAVRFMDVRSSRWREHAGHDRLTATLTDPWRRCVDRGRAALDTQRGMLAVADYAAALGDVMLGLIDLGREPAAQACLEQEYPALTVCDRLGARHIVSTLTEVLDRALTPTLQVQLLQVIRTCAARGACAPPYRDPLRRPAPPVPSTVGAAAVWPGELRIVRGQVRYMADVLGHRVAALRTRIVDTLAVLDRAAAGWRATARTRITNSGDPLEVVMWCDHGTDLDRPPGGGPYEAWLAAGLEALIAGDREVDAAAWVERQWRREAFFWADCAGPDHPVVDALVQARAAARSAALRERLDTFLRSVRDRGPIK